MSYPDVIAACGAPTPNNVETAAWNKLKTGATATSSISLGLFSYDITCIEYFCTEIGVPDGETNCTILLGKGIDGLAFGIDSKITVSPTPARTDFCFSYNFSGMFKPVKSEAICSYELPLVRPTCYDCTSACREMASEGGIWPIDTTIYANIPFTD